MANMMKEGEEEDELPNINWFLSLSKPNLLAGDWGCSSNEATDQAGKRNNLLKRRPSSSHHKTNAIEHSDWKRGRRCNSAKATLSTEATQNGAIAPLDYCRDNVRPPSSNLELVIEAIKMCPEQKGTLNDILAQLSAKFAYFRQREDNESVKNSIRHVLSQNNGLFKKLTARNGRALIWTLAECCDPEITTNFPANPAPTSEMGVPKIATNDDHNYAAPNLAGVEVANCPLNVNPMVDSGNFSNQLFDLGSALPSFIDDDSWRDQNILGGAADDFTLYQDLNYLNCTNFALMKDWDDEHFFNSGNLI